MGTGEMNQQGLKKRAKEKKTRLGITKSRGQDLREHGVHNDYPPLTLAMTVLGEPHCST